MDALTSKRITVTVNGEEIEYDVEARRLLVHFLRDDLDLTGTHVGCDTGNCGACTVLYDGVLAKSCMLLAIQADGAAIETVEGLAQDGELTALQQSFSDHHALQCGYCTPGMLMSATALSLNVTSAHSTFAGGAGLCPAGAQARLGTTQTRRRGLTGETWFPPCFIVEAVRAAAK